MAMSIKLIELAKLVDGTLVGPGDIAVSRLMDLESAVEGDITFLTKDDPARLAATRASAVVVPEGVTGAGRPVIQTSDPNLSAALIHQQLLKRPFTAAGINAGAHIGRDCRLAAEISISPLVVIGDRVRIGRRTVIHPGVVIGDEARIGDDVVLHANVNIGAGCLLGNRVIIHPGSVIGADGFGYATAADGRHFKRPQVGIVQIDDEVEIGANACLDRATFGRTWIKRGTKIDNLVQIAHNVVIGEDSLIVSQAGVAGSSSLGRGVILGGQVGVSGHVKLGNRVMAGAKSGIHNDIADNEVVSGYPAISHRLWLRVCAILPRLPELVREVRALKRLQSAKNEPSGKTGEKHAR